ncbi:hypothetical protein HDU90_003978 [Geranomyces variabilis]|nr:hypothetical protein HDU90_003978 [Geranomyces variabilis]
MTLRDITLAALSIKPGFTVKVVSKIDGQKSQSKHLRIWVGYGSPDGGSCHLAFGQEERKQQHRQQLQQRQHEQQQLQSRQEQLMELDEQQTEQSKKKQGRADTNDNMEEKLTKDYRRGRGYRHPRPKK